MWVNEAAINIDNSYSDNINVGIRDYYNGDINIRSNFRPMDDGVQYL